MTTSIASLHYHRQVYIAFIAAAVLTSTFFSGSAALAFSTTTSSTSSERGSTTSSSIINMADDSNMAERYDDLAARALDAYRDHRGSGHDGALWIACVGGPGAGKTTTAKAVVERIHALATKDETDTAGATSSAAAAVAIPMDGYHYTQAELAKRARPRDDSGGMNRRGAPWTFDARKLAADLAEAKRSGRGSLSEYCREISDPVPDAIQLDGQHSIIIVEGNYLLLGSLEAELDTADGKDAKWGTNLYDAVVVQECEWGGTCKALDCPIPIGDEIRRWSDVTSLFDEFWFIAPPGDGVSEQRRRLIERSLQTWTDAKTEAWGGGTSREAATRRADFNDVRNARLVDCCRQYADVQVDSI